MSILINKDTRLLVQGITGNEGIFHTEQMVAYGTNVVAGVTPGKGGEWVLDGKAGKSCGFLGGTGGSRTPDQQSIARCPSENLAGRAHVVFLVSA